MKELVTHVMSFFSASAQSQTSLFESCPADIPRLPFNTLRSGGTIVGFSIPVNAPGFVSSSSFNRRSRYYFNCTEDPISRLHSTQYSSDSSNRNSLPAFSLSVTSKSLSLFFTCGHTPLTSFTDTGVNHTHFEIQRSEEEPCLNPAPAVLRGGSPTRDYCEDANRGKVARTAGGKIVYCPQPQISQDGFFSFNKMLTSLTRDPAKEWHISRSCASNKIKRTFTVTRTGVKILSYKYERGELNNAGTVHPKL